MAWKLHKGSKYHNQITYVDGQRFDSVKEACRYSELMMLEKAGEIEFIDRQYRYHLIPAQTAPDGTQVKPVDYVADFRYREKGKLVVEDVKGVKTDVYRLKKKLMLKKYGIWIREV